MMNCTGAGTNVSVGSVGVTRVTGPLETIPVPLGIIADASLEIVSPTEDVDMKEAPSVDSSQVLPLPSIPIALPQEVTSLRVQEA